MTDKLRNDKSLEAISSIRVRTFSRICLLQIMLRSGTVTWVKEFVEVEGHRVLIETLSDLLDSEKYDILMYYNIHDIERMMIIGVKCQN